MRRIAILLCIVTAAVAPQTARGAAPTVADKYKITAAERAACSMDAARLCSAAYPDEDLLLACMKENRAALSRICLVVFEAGLKRRHL